MNYKLNVKTDVDVFDDAIMLHLQYGWKFADDPTQPCHVRGFDTMKELKAYIKGGVITCDCKECLEWLAKNK